MFFVWFYAALPVARKSGQGFNVWFFADKSCVTHSFGLSQTSLVLATALVFRRQALCCSQLWSFADKPCVARSHSRMRAVAVDLLSLRHVHLVHQVHQVHQAKCFVTKLAPQLLTAHRVSGLVVCRGLSPAPAPPSPRRARRRYPGLPRCSPIRA